FMPLWSGQDAWRWAEEEDVVSVDHRAAPGASEPPVLRTGVALPLRGSAGGWLRHPRNPWAAPTG
ncbi:hypothetical protein ACWDPF_20100, partial [Streptomyces albogriseolus]